MSRSPFIYYTEADAEADALRLLSELEGGSGSGKILGRLQTPDDSNFNLLVGGHSQNLAYLQFALETLNVRLDYDICMVNNCKYAFPESDSLNRTIRTTSDSRNMTLKATFARQIRAFTPVSPYPP